MFRIQIFRHSVHYCLSLKNTCHPCVRNLSLWPLLRVRGLDDSASIICQDVDRKRIWKNISTLWQFPCSTLTVPETFLRSFKINCYSLALISFFWFVFLDCQKILRTQLLLFHLHFQDMCLHFSFKTSIAVPQNHMVPGCNRKTRLWSINKECMPLWIQVCLSMCLQGDAREPVS